jgi:hypothetical protein
VTFFIFYEKARFLFLPGEENPLLYGDDELLWGAMQCLDCIVVK